jgi:hypothetical protein
MRERHGEAVAHLQKVQVEASELGKKFKAEDDARVEAYKTGTKAPPLVDPAERQRLASECAAKVKAAEEQLQAIASEAVSFIQKNEQEWTEDLDDAAAEARREKEEALLAVERMEQTIADIGRLQKWIERTARNMAGRHLPMTDLGAPLPDKPLVLTGDNGPGLNELPVDVRS